MNRERRIANGEWKSRRSALPNWRIAIGLSLPGILCWFTAGCVQMAAAVTNITGGDWIDAEFELTKEPLLILIDDRNGQITEPKAIREVHQTISENFLEFKVNQRVIPFQEWQNLQSDRKYSQMTIRQVGEKLGAAQVLYIGVERFTLHSEVGAPVFKGEFVAKVKVITTERKKDVRLWPDDESGRRVSVSTQPTPADGDKSPGDIAGELGIKLGQEVAKLFYGRREFQR